MDDASPRQWALGCSSMNTIYSRLKKNGRRAVKMSTRVKQAVTLDPALRHHLGQRADPGALPWAEKNTHAAVNAHKTV